MNSPLRVLHLEDDVRDTKLVQATLEAEGIQNELTRIETEDDFVAALKRGSFDLILADYTLPSFDGLSALRIAQQHSPEVPFLFVSGTLGEDVAIEALKTGATDYVLKTRLSRLAPAVNRALREARERAERRRAEEAARRSEGELRDLIENAPTMMFMALPGPSTAFASRGWREYTGLSAEDTTGSGWQSVIHPEDVERIIEKWRVCSENIKPFEDEARFRRAADGEYRWFLVRAVPLRDESAKIVKWHGVLTDIEDRKRAEGLLAGEKRILEMVAKGDSLTEILDALCRLAEEQATGVLASILLVEGDRLRHGGAPSLPKAYTDAIDGAVIGPSVGSCGTAAHRGEQVIVENIATDPLWADFRDAALPYSLHACWSTPVFSSQGKVIATFAMYYHEPRSPSADDQRIIEQITHLAGISIERKLTQDKLRRSEAYLTEAERLSHTGSWAWDPNTDEMVYCSEEIYRIFGVDRQEGLPSTAKFLERVHPEDRDSVREGRTSGAPEVEYRLMMPDGEVKHILSVGQPILAATGTATEVIGTAVDVTERKHAEALLSGEKRLLEMIATGVPLNEIMTELCAIIEEQRSGTLASVLLLNPDGAHLDVVAGPNLPNEWSRQMEKLPIGPCAGSCGTAAYRRARVIVSDIAVDPLWEVPEHRAAALKHGLHASWSSPVLSSKGNVLGTFCMYYREPRTPTPQDLELIELATHLVRVAIERDRAEEALRTSEQLARSHVEVLMRSLDVLATETASEKFIGEMLRTIGQHLQAIRVMLWLRNQEHSLRLHLVIENDQQAGTDLEHPFVKHPNGWEKKTVFVQEMLFTKAPVACDDIENDSRISPELRKYLTSRGTKRFMTVPMFVAGELRGFIGIHHAEKGVYRADQIELAQALAHHVMLATHGQELVEQQRQAAILKERTRMARDIHDTLAQGFTGVVLQMEAAEEALFEEDPENAVKHVCRARELARESLGEARRSVHALRPQALEKAAFAEALKAIIKNTTAGTALRADFQLQGQPRELSSAVEENLLHIGQEALSNALKHAHATKFQTRVRFDSDAVRLEVRDNGDGFVVENANGGGIGLIGMKERAEQIGATLSVSSRPGSGTRIVAVSPYQNLSA